METTKVVWSKWTVIDLNECDSNVISCWIYDTKSSQLVDRDSMCVLIELFHGMKTNLRLTDQDFHVKNVIDQSWKSISIAECEGYVYPHCLHIWSFLAQYIDNYNVSCEIC